MKGARGIAINLGLFAVLLTIYLLSPVRVMSDTMRYSFIASELVHNQTLDVNRYREYVEPDLYGLRDHNGRLVSFFPWTPAIFEAPVVWVGDAIRDRIGQPPLADEDPGSPFSTIQYQVVTSSILVALSALLMRHIALELLSKWSRGKREWTALGVTLAYGLGTGAWSSATRSLWTHGPVMLLYLCAIWLALKSKRNPRFAALIGIPLAAAYTVRPTAVSLALPIGIWLAIKHRRMFPLAMLGAAFVLIPWFLVNNSLYGTAVPEYFAAGRLNPFAPWVPRSSISTLFSPSRGLFVFSPFLSLAIVGVVYLVRKRVLDGLFIALVFAAIIQWVAVVTFDSWWGGHSYGPRLLTDAVPILVVLAIPALQWIADLDQIWRRFSAGVVACLVLVSGFMNAPGALFRSSVCWNQDHLPTFSEDIAYREIWKVSDSQAITSWRAVFDGDDGLARELNQRRRC